MESKKENTSDLFTFCFTICPGRYWEFYNALSSMLELQPAVKNMMLFFNPYSPKDHESFFDISEVRHSDIIKKSRFTSLAKCWNQCLTFSNTRYALILNDDLVFQDIDLIDKIYQIVHATENWSGFSVDKASIPKMGWFDERFAHSWEDADYRLRMKRLNIPYYRFEPNLIRHTRSQNGRLANEWDASSDHFFRKWGIKKMLKRETGIDYDTSKPEVRKSLLMQGLFNDHFYDHMHDMVEKVMPTPDFYPEKTINYSKGIYHDS